MDAGESVKGGSVLEYGLSTSLSGTDCYLDRLEELVRDGLSCVELCLRPEDDDKSCREAAERVRAARLRVWSIHLPFGGAVDPAEINERRRAENMERIRGLIDGTAELGAAVYVIHGSAEPVGDTERARALEAAGRSLEDLTSHMAPFGLTLALENLPRSCIGRTTEEIGFLLEHVPSLRLCFDTNHFTPLHPDVRFRPFQRKFPAVHRRLNPDPVEEGRAYARRFANRIVTLHISDYDGINECPWHPGQGIVDFYGIHHALMEAGFASPLIFEPNEKCRGVKTTGIRLIRGYEHAIGLEKSKNQ